MASPARLMTAPNPSKSISPSPDHLRQATSSSSRSDRENPVTFQPFSRRAPHKRPPIQPDAPTTPTDLFFIEQFRLDSIPNNSSKSYRQLFHSSLACRWFYASAVRSLLSDLPSRCEPGRPAHAP